MTRGNSRELAAMTRAIGDLAAQVAQPVLKPFYAIALGLPEPIYAWTGVGELTFGGLTYLGTGAFGTLGTIGEASDGSAVGMTATLSGIDPNLADDILAQPYRNASFDVWLGALTDDFQSVAVPPVLLWRGRIDSVALADGPAMAVTITGESRQRDQSRARIKRYTDAQQQARHPGDLFFQYLPSLAEINMVWGKSG